MKLKTDFISNSSSTSFLVYIPRSYPFTTKKILDSFERAKMHFGIQSYKKLKTEDVIKQCQIALTELRVKNCIYDDGGAFPFIIFSTIYKLLDEEGLVLREIETEIPNVCCILSLSEESIEKALNCYSIYGGKK